MNVHRKPPAWVSSPFYWAGTGNRAAAETQEDRYRRLLTAIFRGPCRCWRLSWWRPCCLRNARRYGWGDPCTRHQSRCPACIAEHALHLTGDHPTAAPT